MPKDIFVPGLLDWQRDELRTVTHADDYRFHCLLSFDEVVAHPIGFEHLLAKARRIIDDFDGEPAALICHWDFPSSCLTPILAREYGLVTPSLESVIRCEHKYWARLEQQRVVPECVPEFQALDPFDPDAPDKLYLEFPIWLKPVKAYSSILGFHIENREQLREALADMRDRIGELGTLFDECLRHVDLPDEVQGIGGCHAIAESIMQGEQFACEGYVFNGDIQVHGFLEMLRGHDGRDIRALRYPAALPAPLLKHSESVARRILEQVGFDNGCYNVEYLWDEANDKLWVVEVNTRMSQSHSDLFHKIHGVTNHEIAINVALGMKPTPMSGKGPYTTSAKVLLSKTTDARVLRAPASDELRLLSEQLGDALIVIDAEEGQWLSDLVHQGKYSYIVGEAWIGAHSRKELADKHRKLLETLPIEFSDGEPLDPVDWVDESDEAAPPTPPPGRAPRNFHQRGRRQDLNAG